jgi:adenine-specific DNA-methyltransferase
MIFEFNFNPIKHNPIKAKQYAQYFTNIKIATFMADMLNNINFNKQKILKILDTGAGEGILGVQAVIKCIEMGYKNIHITFYEIDEEMIPLIQRHLDDLKKLVSDKSVKLNIKIISADFVLSRPSEKYNIIIINPPYFKYSVKESKYSNATSDLFKGNPNIYASFMAVCIASLAKKGTLISITPRSFTNGLYFKGFRKFIYDNINFERIHIFKSRDKVFKDSQVLQECIICKVVKTLQKDNIIISSSNSDIDLEDSEYNSYDSNLIIDKSNDLSMLHIPETKKDAEILIRANLLKSTFEQSGYFISTGPVVEHRTREFIVDSRFKSDERYVHLIRPHNIRFMQVDLNINERKDAYFLYDNNSIKHLLKNKTYILLKRFSTKDEKKRLIAAVLSAEYLDSAYIGVGNKLNYIGIKNDELSSKEAVGLSAVFNSKFMDDYFRCFSGNTQVNASEIRIMKFPDRETVKRIGIELKDKEITQKNIDYVVMKNLFKDER